MIYKCQYEKQLVIVYLLNKKYSTSLITLYRPMYMYANPLSSASSDAGDRLVIGTTTAQNEQIS